MLMTGPDGKGVAIINGKSYRVISRFNERRSYGSRRSLGFDLALMESLDEEAQTRRIAGLEAEVSRERERLDEIKAALSDGGES
jgi:hypothetical protein